MVESHTGTLPKFGGNQEILTLSGGRKASLTNQEALDLIESKASTSDQGREPVHLALQKQWFVSIANFLGVSGISGLEGFQNVDPSFTATDASYKANHILPAVMRQVARLSKAQPVTDVMPKSPDIDDAFGAKVGQYFLEHWDDQFDFAAVGNDLAFWQVCCGPAYVFTDWNPRIGGERTSYTNPVNGDLLDGSKLEDGHRKFLESYGGAKNTKTGRMEIEVISPFQLLVPRGFRRLEDMPWIVVEHERSIDWVWDNFPKQANNLAPDDMDAAVDGQYWRRLGSLVNRHGFTLPSQGSEGNETVKVRDMWVPPSGRFPTGFRIMATNKQLLYKGPHPYAAAGIDLHAMPWMRYPISQTEYCRVPGRFWGTGLVEHLVGPQDDYNRTRDQIIQQRDVLGTPQWLAARNAELKSNRNDYGDIWEYNAHAGGKPELVNPPALSQLHQATAIDSLSDMGSISLQNDASQGEVPTGVRSGSGLRALQEKDTMGLTYPVRSLEACYQDMSRKLLTLTWKFMPEEQMINTYGEFRTNDVKVLKGSEINGNVFVRVKRGSMMPKSQAESQESLMNLLQVGAMNPANPEHQQMIMDIMDFGNTDLLFEGRNLDKRRATHENQRFLRPELDEQGQPVPFPDVEDHDNHAVHLQEHVKFMKTDAYEYFPPMRKMQFQAHLMKHEQIMAQMVQTQMAMQAGPQSGSDPAEKGEASQPANKNPTPGQDAKAGAAA